MEEVENQKYNWKLGDIFKNEEEFNKAKNEIKQMLKQLKIEKTKAIL